MLRPQDNVAREARRLDGLWGFRIDPDGTGREERWWSGPLTDEQLVPVPASYNDVLVDPAVHDHVGDAWYQRLFTVPPSWAGRRVVLRFDAACHRAKVWLDDDEVVSHEGGYTPFEADVTELVGPGEDHRLTVVVDNRLSWQSLPPGVVLPGGPNGLVQFQLHDFFNYAGLHRSVWLYATPTTRIEDVTVVTERHGSMGLVRCTVELAGYATTSVRHQLRDEARELVS